MMRTSFVRYLPRAHRSHLGAPVGVSRRPARRRKDALSWRCFWRSSWRRRLHAPSSWPGSILIGHGRSPLALTSKSSNGCGWRFFGCGRSCSSHEASSRSNRPRPGRHKGVSWASGRPSGTSQTCSRWGCGYRWVLWLVTACTRVARSPHRSWCISPTDRPEALVRSRLPHGRRRSILSRSEPLLPTVRGSEHTDPNTCLKGL